MVAAAVIGTVGAAAIGASASRSAASRAADAQNRATDAATQASSEANQLSRDQFNWNKDIYERDIRPAQQRSQDLNERIANDALESSRQQREFSNEQRQYYKDTFQPLERQMVDEAKNYDSADNVARRSGIAAANVNQQFSNARGQSARLAGRYGLGSTAFSGPAGASERAQALGSAGAQTGAAFDTMDKAIALRAGAANFGRNMPNTAATFGQIGNQSSGVASNAAGAGMNAAIAGGNFMNNAYGSRINGLTNATGMFTNAMNNSANYYGNQAAGWGNFAGNMAYRGLSMPGGFSGAQAAFSQTDLGSSGFGTGLAYGNQDYGQFI